MYLNSLIQSGSVSEERKKKAQAEKDITIPQDTLTKNKLCGTEKTYWPSLESSATQAVCQDKNILAIADFMDTTGNGEMKYASIEKQATSPMTKTQYLAASGYSELIDDNNFNGTWTKAPSWTTEIGTIINSRRASVWTDRDM